MNALMIPLLAAAACVAPTPKGSDTTVDSARPGDSGPTDSAPPTDSTTTDGPHTYTVVNAHWATVCAVRDDAEVVCWGADAYAAGVLSPPPGPFVDVSIGATFACGRRPDGHVTCWGDYGWLGEGPELAGTWADFDCGNVYACGVEEGTGRVRCLGSGSADGEASPPELEAMSAVRAGSAFTCAVDTAGGPTCWGYQRAKPSQPQPDGVTLSSFEVGLAYACGVEATSGSAVCWGQDNGQQATVPEGLGPVLDVGAAELTTCAVTVAGEVTCWGYFGVLGKPSEPGGFVSVAVGDWFACALDEAGEISCWGDNTYGQTEAPG